MAGRAQPTKEVLEMVAAVEELSVGGGCSNCGHNDWIPFAEPVLLESAASPDGAFNCLALACRHCGFVRLHAELALKSHRRPPAAQ